MGKGYTNERRVTKFTCIKEGDKVLVKQKKWNKLSTHFSSEPYTVVVVKGSKVAAQNQSHFITRNLLFFKKIPSDLQGESDGIDDIPASTTSTQNERKNDREEISSAAPTRRSRRNCAQTDNHGHILSHQR